MDDKRFEGEIESDDQPELSFKEKALGCLLAPFYFIVVIAIRSLLFACCYYLGFKLFDYILGRG